MTQFSNPGKIFLIVGACFIGIGIILLIFSKHLGWIGKLPGDIVIKKENFTFYFPLTSCLLLSAFLTLLFQIFGKK